MYNVEKYVAECLDSLLYQTFQDFEVIIVNDCSTDNSRAIAESYVDKFNGRLKIFDNEKNSGPGASRNNGLRRATGEYVFFMDADDLMLPIALEEMYTPAKKFDSDFIYIEIYYAADEAGIIFNEQLIRGSKKVNKPTLYSEDLTERVNFILNRFIFGVPWCEFSRREFLLENELFFPNVLAGEDLIWTLGLFLFSKRYLRIPGKIYIQRQSKGSILRTRRTPLQRALMWLRSVVFGLKFLDETICKLEFFQQNSRYRYAILERVSVHLLGISFRKILKLQPYTFYEGIKNEFGDKLGEYDVLISMLCTLVNKYQKTISSKDEEIAQYMELIHNYTARANMAARTDIKFLSTEGDFQVISVSDDEAMVIKPGWFQNNGVGYQIESSAGKLNLIVKAAADGQIDLSLRGIDVHSSEDKSKRIPYWIDYTNLTIDGETIFDNITPAWHDKPYKHKINAKAGKEITIQIKWIPHNN